jgi:hypothetical protein
MESWETAGNSHGFPIQFHDSATRSRTIAVRYVRLSLGLQPFLLALKNSNAKSKTFKNVFVNSTTGLRVLKAEPEATEQF